MLWMAHVGSRKLLLAGCLALMVAFAGGGLAVHSLTNSGVDTSAITDDSSSSSDSGGANGADLAYETEWSQTQSRQVHINSPACAATSFSEADCLANPGRWVSEPYVTVRHGYVCAQDFDEATRLAGANDARVTGRILDQVC